MTYPVVNRPLDAGEKFFWMLDHVSCTNFVVFAEMDRQLESGRLQEALQRLQRRHPLLNCHIVADASGQLEFRSAPATAITLQIETVASENWAQPLQAQLALPFVTQQAPLLRALYVPFSDQAGSIVGLCFHHSIADGRSGTALLRELLAGLLGGQPMPHTVRAEPPPMHALFPAEFDWLRRPGKIASIYAGMRADIQRYGTPADLPWLEQRQTAHEPRLIRVELEASETNALLLRCREQHTTVHGALGAAQLLAKRRALDTDGNATLTLSQPVAMRPYLAEPVPEDGLGLYVTLLSANYPVNADSDFWGLARAVVGDIRRQMRRGDGHLLFTLLRTQAIPATPEGLQAFAGSMLASPQCSMLSNIGRVALLDDAPQVRSISFALCPMPYQALFTAASCYNGRLILNINYDAARLAPQMAAQLAGTLHGLLLKHSSQATGR